MHEQTSQVQNLQPLGDGPPWMRRPVWQSIIKALGLEKELVPVLDGLLRELSPAQIAQTLGVSEGSIKSSCRALRNFCHCRSLTGVMIALVRMTTTPSWRDGWTGPRFSGADRHSQRKAVIRGAEP